MLVLAEPSVQRFSHRIAEDLPDDLAVVSYTQLLKGGRVIDLCLLDGFDEPLPLRTLGVSRCSNDDNDHCSLEGQLVQETAYEMDLSSMYRTQIISIF